MSCSIPLNTTDCKNQNRAKRLKILCTSGFTNSCTEIILESRFAHELSCVILTKLTILSTMACYCLLPLKDFVIYIVGKRKMVLYYEFKPEQTGETDSSQKCLQKKLLVWKLSKKATCTSRVESYEKSDQVRPRWIIYSNPHLKEGLTLNLNQVAYSYVQLNKNLQD